MPPGKMAAQAGHAFVEALLASDPENACAYRNGTIGTKVVLAGDLSSLLRAENACEIFSVPHALIEDSGHVLLPHFDGRPIVTALGVGLSPHAHRIVKRFKLWENGHEKG